MTGFKYGKCMVSETRCQITTILFSNNALAQYLLYVVILQHQPCEYERDLYQVNGIVIPANRAVKNSGWDVNGMFQMVRSP
jgi:hypothetical protein